MGRLQRWWCTYEWISDASLWHSDVIFNATNSGSRDTSTELNPMDASNDTDVRALTSIHMIKFRCQQQCLKWFSPNYGLSKRLPNKPLQLRWITMTHFLHSQWEHGLTKARLHSYIYQFFYSSGLQALLALQFTLRYKRISFLSVKAWSLSRRCEFIQMVIFDWRSCHMFRIL